MPLLTIFAVLLITTMMGLPVVGAFLAADGTHVPGEGVAVEGEEAA